MEDMMLIRYWILAGMTVISHAQTFTILGNFERLTSGMKSPLVQGADGSFYGTTANGGANFEGMIYKIAPGGALTTVASFVGVNGRGPFAPLTVATDGSFYGTTRVGGAHSGGTVFKVTPAGVVTTIYSFGGLTDGAEPEGGLIQAADGNFYGTTYMGGASGEGTVFKVTAGGTLTTLYSFPAGGLGPTAALVQGADGNFYGTTSGAIGTAFKITPGGVLTALCSLKSPSGLTQGNDGNFYGTTNDGDGTVFKLTPGGTLTVLHTFNGSDGYNPSTGVILGTDGNFYGTTDSGGGPHADLGTIFKMTPEGTLTTLYRFMSDDNGDLAYGVIEGADGNLYGVTSSGGANNGGTVFELQLALPTSSSTPTITLVQNAEGGASTIAPNTWVTILGSNLAPAGDSRTWQASDFVNNQLPTQLDGISVVLNGEKAFVNYLSPTQINILTPPDLATGTAQVQVATNAGTSAPFPVQVQAESPSFFVFGGGAYVAATHADASLIGPTKLYPGQSTPAQPGETIVLYANGFGPTSTPVVSGSETQSGSLNPLPTVAIGGTSAIVQFAGLISPGLFQFNVVVPASTPAGDNALTASYNSLSTQSGVLLTVGP
jgi:uncharacterized protein (TIGR03437 family)